MSVSFGSARSRLAAEPSLAERGAQKHGSNATNGASPSLALKQEKMPRQEKLCNQPSGSEMAPQLLGIAQNGPEMAPVFSTDSGAL
jgi:hypothetical protein